MTQEELTAIEARAKAATPGPWFWRTGTAKDSHTTLFSRPKGMNIVLDCVRDGAASAIIRFNVGGIMRKARELAKARIGQEHNARFDAHVDHPDADFIAHARDDVPALIAALRTALRERDEAREAIHAAYIEGHCMAQLETSDENYAAEDWADSDARAALEHREGTANVS